MIVVVVVVVVVARPTFRLMRSIISLNTESLNKLLLKAPKILANVFTWSQANVNWQLATPIRPKSIRSKRARFPVSGQAGSACRRQSRS